ncbi:MAG: PEP-CTERM/exosortase system-associated acyltransferase [Methyloprofundus sp.]|nr:PEP-CTERM/exosortase system-associated acyltransferase [Methyloprofundus sp.]
MTSNENTLIEDFERYFRIELVTSEEQAKAAYAVRYRVYCEEFEYEATDLFPDQLETDEFDEQSLHCLIIHKERDIVAGCIRLVSVNLNNENGLLPFEKFCQKSLDTELINSFHLERNTQCEISRLAVDGAFRRRPGEAPTRFGEIESIDCTKQEQRTFSLIAVSAFLAATALTELTHKTNVFAMMEPFLPRLFKRSGFLFERVGSDMDYHGIRALYFTTTQSALDNMRPDLRELYDWVYKQVARDYAAY